MTGAPSAGLSAEPKATYFNTSYTLKSWLFTTDHKRIALLYLLVASGFAALGGAAALLLRYELVTPQQELLQDLYARLFTVHGGAMVFLFILPAMLGVLANFLLPLMLGAENMAHPRLNLLSFYLYAVGSSVAVAEITYGGSDAGWNFFAPYSTQFTDARILPGLTLLLLVSVGMALMAYNIFATVQKRRIRGMQLEKLPMTVWGFYVASKAMLVGALFMLVWIILTATFREMSLGYVSYNLDVTQQLLVHSFWIYAHTTIYMLMLPAIGIVADIVATFARRPLFGRTGVRHSMMGLAVLTSLSWGIHLFTGAQWSLLNLFFSLLAYLGAVPLAVIILSLFNTLRQGKTSGNAAMVFAYGVLMSLALYWASSLALYSPLTAQALLNTQFESANFHFLMLGVVTMAFLAAIHFWWPKATGKQYSEFWAKISAWSMIFGILGLLLPGLLLGLQGMRTRVVAYPAGWQMLNQLASTSSLLIALGFALPGLYFLFAILGGKDSDNNPWETEGLEWRTTSPPPPQNFSSEMLK